ncbi:transposable element Tcb2 transposase [Trichonephila clavipes]|nr:transposable element Tcb2 transposase [Trichonephila clavipes]
MTCQDEIERTALSNVKHSEFLFFSIQIDESTNFEQYLYSRGPARHSITRQCGSSSTPLRVDETLVENIPENDGSVNVGDTVQTIASRVARQLSRCDCVVRRCWEQRIREKLFTRRLSSGRPRQTSRREHRHIVKNAGAQPTASSAAIQAKVAPLLGAPVSSRTRGRRLAEGHLGSRRPLRAALDAHLSTPLFVVVPRTRKLDCSGIEPGCL